MVPENLITVDEIPEYAGLYYIRNNWLYKIKEAPFIHKNKDNYDSILCSKFYFKWLKGRP